MNEFPSGLTGEIAQYLLSQAITPVPKIALAGAIGCMSGVVGRSYQVSGTGLNQYTVLLAPSGSGKGAMRLGINRLFSAVKKEFPEVVSFWGPTEITDKSRLIKHLKISPSFCSILGEVSDIMRSMGTDGPASKFYALNHFLRDVYDMSATGMELEPSLLRGNANINAKSPAISVLGESASEPWDSGLEERNVTNGLLARFNVIEHSGEIPMPQKNIPVPPAQLVSDFGALCKMAYNTDRQNMARTVKLSTEAEKYIADVHSEQHRIVNDKSRGMTKSLYTRLALKTLKLAATFAVGCDPKRPEISEQQIKSAYYIVHDGCDRLKKSFKIKTTASADYEREQEKLVVETIKEYFRKPWKDVKKYALCPEEMHSSQIVPYGYLQKRISMRVLFEKNPGGRSRGLTNTLLRLVKNGTLELINTTAMDNAFGYTGDSYRLI